MSRTRLRAVLPGVYVLAILVTVFFGNGKATAAVAALGAIALGLCYQLLRPEPGEGRQRNRKRGGRADLGDRTDPVDLAGGTAPRAEGYGTSAPRDIQD